MASWGLIAGCHARCGHGTAAFPCSRNTAEPQPFPLLLTFSISTFFLKANCGQFPRFYYCKNVKLFFLFSMYSEVRLWMSIMNIIILTFFLQSHLFLFRLKVQCTFGTEAFKWILLFKIYLLLQPYLTKSKWSEKEKLLIILRVC